MQSHLNQSDLVYMGKTKLDWTSIISTADEVKFVNIESPSLFKKKILKIPKLSL